MGTRNEQVNIIFGAKESAQLKSVFGSVKNQIIGIGAAYMGLSVIKDAFVAIIDAGSVAEKTWLSVASSLRRHNIEVDTGIQKITAFADSMQTMTGISDETIGAMTQQFIDYGATVDQATSLMRTAIDMSVGSGTDLKTAVDLLSKAQVGYTATLSRYGIIVDESLTKMEKFKRAQELINERFGGAAAAVMDSASVKIALLKEQFGDFGETLYGLFSPAVVAAVDAMSGMVTGLTRLFGSGTAPHKVIKQSHDQVRSFDGAATDATGAVYGLTDGVNQLTAAMLDADVATSEYSETLGRQVPILIGYASDVLGFLSKGLYDTSRNINQAGMWISQGIIDIATNIAEFRGVDFVEGLIKQLDDMRPRLAGIAKVDISEVFGPLAPSQDEILANLQGALSGVESGFNAWFTQHIAEREAAEWAYWQGRSRHIDAAVQYEIDRQIESDQWMDQLAIEEQQRTQEYRQEYEYAHIAANDAIVADKQQTMKELLRMEQETTNKQIQELGRFTGTFMKDMVAILRGADDIWERMASNFADLFLNTILNYLAPGSSFIKSLLGSFKFWDVKANDDALIREGRRAAMFITQGLESGISDLSLGINNAISPAIAPAVSGGDTYHITINASGGTAADIAAEVERVVGSGRTRLAMSPGNLTGGPVASFV